MHGLVFCDKSESPDKSISSGIQPPEAVGSGRRLLVAAERMICELLQSENLGIGQCIDLWGVHGTSTDRDNSWEPRIWNS